MANAVLASNESLNAPLPWQTQQWAQLSRAVTQGTLAHAYLLCGSEGLGKALFADEFARYALCASPVKTAATGEPQPSEPQYAACTECGNCRKTLAGSHPDIIKIEVEEGSKNLKIDQVRWLAEFVTRSSHAGGRKIAIIEQAHLLNLNAANALLKTLEEPNDKTHLLLVTDHPGRLMATIRSRCQKLSFLTPGTDSVLPWLQAKVGDAGAGSLLAAAQGRPLVALQLAEGDSIQTRTQLFEGLCEIKAGRKSIQQVLALSSKMGESEVLRHFSWLLSTLTKYSLSGVREGERDAAVNDAYALLPRLDNPAATQSIASTLARFYLEVETARAQLASTSNPNQQLIMESLLWRWSELRLN